MLLANFNGKEHLRHRAVSLRQHGFLVLKYYRVRKWRYLVLARWLAQSFPAWRHRTVWFVTTANALMVWRCCLGTPNAVPHGTSQWLTPWVVPISNRVPSPGPVRPRLQLRERQTKYSSLCRTHDFLPVALETLGPKSGVSAQEFLTQIDRDPRETAFLLQRLFVAVQRFNAACLADKFLISESLSWPFQTFLIMRPSLGPH